MAAKARDLKLCQQCHEYQWSVISFGVIVTGIKVCWRCWLERYRPEMGTP